MGRRTDRGEAGLTLLEILISSVVLVIAILGSFSLIVSVQTHNQSFSDSRLATKACQEVMEMVLADSHATPNLATWVNKWNTIGTQNDGGFFVPRLHVADSAGNYELGRVRITDISSTVTIPNHSTSPPAGPYLYEIAVSVNGKARNGSQVTLKPLSVLFVSRRSAK